MRGKPSAAKPIVMGVLAGAALMVLVRWTVLYPRPTGPSDTARQALDMARDAQARADSARRTGSVFRVVATVIGVSAPLITVYLIHRLQARDDGSPDEMLQVLEGQNLLSWPEPRVHELPTSSGGANGKLPDRASDTE